MSKLAKTGNGGTKGKTLSSSVSQVHANFVLAVDVRPGLGSRVKISGLGEGLVFDPHSSGCPEAGAENHFFLSGVAWRGIGDSNLNLDKINDIARADGTPSRTSSRSAPVSRVGSCTNNNQSAAP